MGRFIHHLSFLVSRRAGRLAVASAAVLATGCSGSGPLTRRMTTIGALKNDVAQLESEKDQNRRELAEVQAENRRISNQLAEAEDENNELASRLNDARQVIARQGGGDSDKFSPPSRSASDSDRPNARKATPAGSRTKGRKTPMAEIPRDRKPLRVAKTCRSTGGWRPRGPTIASSTIPAPRAEAPTCRRGSRSHGAAPIRHDPGSKQILLPIRPSPAKMGPGDAIGGGQAAMIVVIDYGMGNLRSVQKALEFVHAKAEVTCDPDRVRSAEKVILPGVGAFADAAAELRRTGLGEAFVDAVNRGRPCLGVCLGLQLLFDESEEDGLHRGLGLIPGRVVRFAAREGLKVPHMGWNTLSLRRPSPLFAGLEASPSVYFVHSYHAEAARADDVAAEASYPDPFCASVWRDNLMACQFHPEKSQGVGLAMYANFAAL